MNSCIESMAPQSKSRAILCTHIVLPSILLSKGIVYLTANVYVAATLFYSVLLCSISCSRCWSYSNEQNEENPCSPGTYFVGNIVRNLVWSLVIHLLYFYLYLYLPTYLHPYPYLYLQVHAIHIILWLSFLTNSVSWSSFHISINGPSSFFYIRIISSVGINPYR